MPRAPKRFSPDAAEHLDELEITRQRWHTSIAADLLTSSKHGASDKVVALSIDEGGSGARCRYTRSTIATRSLQTVETVRKATKRLSAAGWLAREQRGSASWTYRLLAREPAAWLPGWGMPWYRSTLAADLPPECLLLWALAIQHTPSAALRSSTPGLGPWCELPERELARQLRCSHNSVAAICEGAYLGGLILLLTRNGRTPIIYPLVDAVTREDRSRLALCLLDAVADRDGTASGTTLHGPEGATVWDDDELAEVIARKTGTDKRKVATPA